jgi:hypothetical protein
MLASDWEERCGIDVEAVAGLHDFPDDETNGKMYGERFAIHGEGHALIFHSESLDTTREL